MKRILSIMLVMLILISMVGCANKSKKASNGVEIMQYTGLDIKKADYVISEQYLEYALNEILETYAAVEQIKEGTVKKGDTVSLSYVSYVNEQKLEEATISNYNFTIGEGKFTEAFEKELEGKPIGEEFSITISYPFNSTYTILDGKTVTHKVTIHYLASVTYPELNDEFIKTHVKNSVATKEKACKTVAEYKAYLKERYEFVYTKKARELAVVEILNAIMENAKFPELPEDEIKKFVDARYAYYVDYCKELGMTIATYYMMTGITEADFLAQLHKDGEEFVKKEMIIEAVKEFENIELTDSYYEEYLNSLLIYYQFDTIEELKNSIQSLGVEETIRSDALYEMVYDFLIENQKIQLETIDVFDLTKKEGESE